MGAHNGKVAGLLVGLGVGALLGGPWVALFAAAGLVLGHLFDRGHDPSAHDSPREAPPTSAEIDREAQLVFARHLAVLVAQVSGSGAFLDASRLAAFHEFLERSLGFEPAACTVVEDALRSPSQIGGSLEAASEACRDELDQADRHSLFFRLHQFVKPGGDPAAIAALTRLGLLLGVGDRLFDLPAPGDLTSAFEDLGSSPDATDEELRRAFRREAALHHPDKVAHLGPEAVALATERFRRLQRAWDTIRRERRPPSSHSAREKGPRPPRR